MEENVSTVLFPPIHCQAPETTKFRDEHPPVDTTAVNLPVEYEVSRSQDQAKFLDTPVKLEEQPWLISIPQQKRTEERKPFIANKDDALATPGTARATIAASRESPNGTVEDGYAAKHQNQVVV
jgi:hypothetical protein